MAANTYWFTKAFLNAFGGVDGSKGINFKNDEISVALLGDTYTPNQALHESWADVSAYEISGTGYTSLELPAHKLMDLSG